MLVFPRKKQKQNLLSVRRANIIFLIVDFRFFDLQISVTPTRMLPMLRQLLFGA